MLLFLGGHLISPFASYHQLLITELEIRCPRVGRPASAHEDWALDYPSQADVRVYGELRRTTHARGKSCKHGRCAPASHFPEWKLSIRHPRRGNGDLPVQHQHSRDIAADWRETAAGTARAVAAQ